MNAECINQTSAKICTPLKSAVLVELQKNTSVTWRCGRCPASWRPRGGVYVSFNMAEGVLAYHSKHVGLAGCREVTAENFVQTVAVFCPQVG